MVTLSQSSRAKRLVTLGGALVVGFVIATLLVSAARPEVETVDEVALDNLTARQVGEASPSRSVGSPDPDRDVESVSRSIGEQSPGQPEAPEVIERPVFGTPETTTPGSSAPDSTTTTAESDVADSTVTAPEATSAEPNLSPTGPTTPPSSSPSSPTTSAPNSSSPTTRAPAASPTTTRAPSTTAAPTTMPEDSQPHGTAFSTGVFTNWPIRNTNMDGRQQFVSTPASQIGVNNFIEGSDRAIGLGSVTANKHLGQFRTQCSFSHFNYDDPLVFPGQPGRAHLHMYFGNTQANASSNYRSLRDSGSSTCNGFEGNRSAYWIPAVFDASGNVRIPSRIELYYKSHDGSQSIVQKPPEGLGMVAGQAATNPYIAWGCQETGAQGTNLSRPVQQIQNTIPACSRTATLLAHIKFPQCLSGNITENSGNATAQMQYPNGGYYSKNCPAGTQYITSIEFFIAWNPDNHDGNTSNWWISSDVRADGTRAPNGSTLHGDWFGAWHPELMDTIHDNCIARLAECSWDLVDNNRRLTWIEHYGSKNPASYNGRRAIPASEISDKLCPGEHFAKPEDAAFCGGHGH